MVAKTELNNIQGLEVKEIHLNRELDGLRGRFAPFNAETHIKEWGKVRDYKEVLKELKETQKEIKEKQNNYYKTAEYKEWKKTFDKLNNYHIELINHRWTAKQMLNDFDRENDEESVKKFEVIIKDIDKKIKQNKQDLEILE